MYRNFREQFIPETKDFGDFLLGMFKILIDSIKSILLMEHEEVMSVEGIEVNLFNEEIYGVSYEAEIKNREVFKKKLLGL